MSRPKRSNVKMNISLTQLESFLNGLNEIGCEYDSEEGVLLDYYWIEDTNDIKLGRYAPRKHIFIDVEYINTQQSKNVLTMTDDSELYQAFVDRFN